MMAQIGVFDGIMAQARYQQRHAERAMEHVQGRS